MKRALSFVTLLLFLLPLSFAQKKEAKEILDNTTKLFMQGDTYQIKFIAETFVGKEKQAVADGKLLLKDDKFVFETYDMKTWYDGKTQWSLIFDSEEVNVTEPTTEELQEINPYVLLKLYKKGYTYTLVSSKSENGVPVKEVELRATSKDREIQQINIWINSNSYQPFRLKVVRNNQEKVFILIYKLEKVKTLANDEFTFNKQEYPEYDIIDLR